MERPSQDLDDRLRACTVRLSIESVSSRGTGFFVAPGLILTCAHVVEAARNGTLPVQVHWQNRTLPAQIDTFLPKPYPDLALLHLDGLDHPCVYLNDRIGLNDRLYSWGFPDDYPNGDSVTLIYEGPTQAGEHGNQVLHKLKAGQVRPGLSGAALLNLRTGGICGIVRATRNRSTNLGGRAVPLVCIPVEYDLPTLQQQYHQRYTHWLDCLDSRQQQYIPWPVMPSPNPFLGESRELVGRDEEIRRILEKLRAGNHCSIVGPSGSGTSHLLRELQKQFRSQFEWQPQEVCPLNFRSIDSVMALKEAIVIHLGGQKAGEFTSLLYRKPLKIILLDHIGGMDPGPRGLDLRRRLRALGDEGIRLVMVSNERLDILFRRDDPTRDSPLAGLDPIPVQLRPLSADLCRQVVQQRLDGTPVNINHFTDLFGKAWQPRDLVNECARRVEEMRQTRP